MGKTAGQLFEHYVICMYTHFANMSENMQASIAIENNKFRKKVG